MLGFRRNRVGSIRYGRIRVLSAHIALLAHRSQLDRHVVILPLITQYWDRVTQLHLAMLDRSESGIRFPILLLHVNISISREIQSVGVHLASTDPGHIRAARRRMLLALSPLLLCVGFQFRVHAFFSLLLDLLLRE